MLLSLLIAIPRCCTKRGCLQTLRQKIIQYFSITNEGQYEKIYFFIYCFPYYWFGSLHRNVFHPRYKQKRIVICCSWCCYGRNNNRIPKTLFCKAGKATERQHHKPRTT